MSKRPLEDASTSPAKKLCLEDLKSNLNALLEQAAEHHEEARLFAVDRAFELEESWNDAEDNRKAMTATLKELQTKCQACEEYEKKISESPVAMMLSKVSETDVHGIDTLSDDQKKLDASLKQLQTLYEATLQQKSDTESTLQKQTILCENFKKKHEEAEAKAEKITKLNETM
jgi:hypothetical protein|tara:strand:- start:1045 stop:1563 length:519 start_codon:yes stop_codon:yes gene_type:complete